MRIRSLFFHSPIVYSLFLMACFSTPKVIYVTPPEAPTGETPQATNGPNAQTIGSQFIDQQVLNIRQKLQKASFSTIPSSFFEKNQTPFHCSLIRFRPSQKIHRETKLSFSKLLDSQRQDGFAVDAHFTQGIAQGEQSTIPLWYDFRGHLVGTITLPPKDNRGNDSWIETPENREEYIVIGFLQETKEWVWEWQRKISSAASPSWTSLPQAILVPSTDPYHPHFKATAYMLCKEQINP